MMNEITICQCCEAISELTHDETINEILNYIETKATHMNNKLVEYKENCFTRKELDYIYMKIFGYSKDVSYCVDFSKQEKHDIEVSILEKILELKGESHDK